MCVSIYIYIYIYIYIVNETSKDRFLRILLSLVCDGWTDLNAHVTSECCLRLIKDRFENVAISVR